MDWTKELITQILSAFFRRRRPELLNWRFKQGDKCPLNGPTDLRRECLYTQIGRASLDGYTSDPKNLVVLLEVLKIFRQLMFGCPGNRRQKCVKQFHCGTHFAMVVSWMIRRSYTLVLPHSGVGGEFPWARGHFRRTGVCVGKRFG